MWWTSSVFAATLATHTPTMRFIVPLGFLGSQTEHNKHIYNLFAWYWSLQIAKLEEFKMKHFRTNAFQVEHDYMKAVVSRSRLISISKKSVSLAKNKTEDKTVSHLFSNFSMRTRIENQAFQIFKFKQNQWNQ